MGKVVGIDLGTTNSVVAVMEGGKPIVIANAEGMRTTPSVVAFSKEGELLVGQMARRQSVLNPQNTFFGVKRYIGRRYSEVSPESKRVPYTLRRDENSNVKIKCPRLEKEFAPEEISAMILRKLADEASRYLGEPVTGAVITVPAYFNDSQRQATRDAGRIAGLEVKRIINEPTAASLAYGLDRADNQTILVFDLGGGTFDVSILDVGDGVFEVKATAGDTQLGGTDFDKKIVDWLADQFLDAENIDLRRDRQSLQRLLEASEKAKIELSGVSVSEINLPFITATEDGPKHLETRLTRSQFEGLCTDLISRLRGPVKQAMRDAGLYPEDIDEVVLVGGSTRMPMVKELVRSLIDREPNENVNPDEVVAVGAAIQAGILTQEVRDILLLDVTPLSLGLETIGGVMKKLIPRNTTIPVRRSDIFSTAENNQTMVEVHALQGEREMASDNKSLGRFKLMGIPPAPRGVPQVQVSFDIDANGILQVTAVDRTTGREQGITIQGASTLGEDEVQRMIQDAEKFAQQDRQRREQVEKRTRAEALTYQAERQLREVALDFGMQFASNHRRRIENLVQDLRDALKKDEDRAIDVAEADLRDALYELQQEIYDFNKEEEDEGILGSIKRTLFGDEDEDDFFYRGDRDTSRWDDRNDPWGSRRDPWDERRDPWSTREERRAPARDSWDSPAGDRRRDTWDDRPTDRRPAARDSWNDRPTDRRPATRDTWDEPPVDRRPTARDNWDDRSANRRPAARDSWDEPSADRRPAPRNSWDEPSGNRRPAARDSRDESPADRRPAPRNSWDEPSGNRRPAARDSWDESSVDRRPAPRNSWDEPSGSSRPAARDSRDDRPTNRRPAARDNWDEPPTNRRPAARDSWDEPPTDRRPAAQDSWDDPTPDRRSAAQDNWENGSGDRYTRPERRSASSRWDEPDRSASEGWDQEPESRPSARIPRPDRTDDGETPPSPPTSWPAEPPSRDRWDEEEDVWADPVPAPELDSASPWEDDTDGNAWDSPAPKGTSWDSAPAQTPAERSDISRRPSTEGPSRGDRRRNSWDDDEDEWL